MDYFFNLKMDLYLSTGKKVSNNTSPYLFSLFISFLIILGTGISAFSTTITTAGTGNWNSTTVNAPWPGGIVPLSTDSVIIASSHTVTVNASAICAGLTVNSNGKLNINTSISLTVNGLVRMLRPATSQTNTIAVGAGVLICNSLTMEATTTTRNNIITISTGTLTINGTLTTGSTGCRITISATGTINLGGTISGAPYMSMASGSTVNYFAAGAQTVIPVSYSKLTLSGSGVKTTTGVTVTSILSMEGTATASVAPTYGGAATLQYNSSISHTCGAEWLTPFAASGGVVIAGTGTITMNEAKVFNSGRPLTINSGAALSTGNYQLSFGGDFHNNGGTFTAGSSPIIISNILVTHSIDGFTTTGPVSLTKTAGTATFKGNVQGGDLIINGTGGTLNLGAALTHVFSGNLVRTAGTLNGGSSILKIGGSVSGSTGTFTASTGTVEWNAAGDQTIAGVIYYNLTISGSGTKTIATGTTVTVTKILSMEGTASVALAGTLTYGSSAALHYNTASSINTSAEWIASFNGTGGIVIENTGTITLNAAKSLNASVPLTISPGATLATGNFQLTVGGNFVNGGTFTTGSSSIVIAGTTTQNIAGFTTTGSVSMTKTGGTATFAGNVQGSDLIINGTGGTLNLGTGLTHTFSGNWTRTAGTLNGGSSTLKIGGSVSGTGGTFTTGTGTVEWNAEGAQTIAGVTYYNLTLSGSGVKTLTGVRVNVTFSIEGTATVFGAPTYGGTSALRYNTTTSRSAGVEWITPFVATGGVVIAGTGTITMNGAKVFNSGIPLTINSGASLNTNNFQLNFGGDFHNLGGTFTAGSSPIIITTTAGTQSIDGFTTTGTVSMTKTGGTATFTSNVQANGLTIIGSGGTLNLGSGLTHVFSGNWTRTNGTINGGSSLLKIGGSVTGTGGSFVANTGTVEWNSAGAQTLAGVTYNNLTLSGSGAKTTTGVIVNGILSMEGTATASAAIVYGASGTLKYNGSAIQTTSITEFPPSNGPANLTINNSNGVSLVFDRSLSGNLTINTGTAFTINPGISLTVLGTTANNAGNTGLQIKSDATGTGNIIHNTSGVVATVERYITGDATKKPIHYISSPVSNASFNNIWQPGDYNAYWYDETKTTSTTSACWIRILGNATLASTKGYYVVSQYLSRTNSFIGNLTIPSDISNSAAVTYTSSVTPANSGWNLLGNPYPCAINASAFVTANASAFDVGYAAVYYWDDVDGVKNGSQDYATHNSTGGTAAPGNPTNVPNNQISVGQGFFVKVASGTTTLSMAASMRTTNNSPQFFITDPPEIQRIWVSVNGPNDLSNEILLGFFDGATTGIDHSYDAIKFRGNSNIALYSVMDGFTEGFAIQALPPITKKTEVKLGLGAGIAGNYSLTVKNIKDLDPQVSIYLKDLVTGAVTDLRKDSTYQVTLNPGEYKSRFLLQFYQNNATTINEKVKSETVDIYAYGNKIYISGQIKSDYPITITDITGRSAGNYKVKSGSVNEINTDGLSGIYLVSVLTDNGIITKKILCNISK